MYTAEIKRYENDTKTVCRCNTIVGLSLKSMKTYSRTRGIRRQPRMAGIPIVLGSNPEWEEFHISLLNYFLGLQGILCSS